MRNRRVRERGWRPADRPRIISGRDDGSAAVSQRHRTDQAKSKQKKPINPAIANPAPATCIRVAKRIAECRFDD
jgi:hypothetical protein